MRKVSSYGLHIGNKNHLVLITCSIISYEKWASHRS